LIQKEVSNFNKAFKEKNLPAVNTNTKNTELNN